jgi:peptide/nickel transport system ATP-binding protein/oligopeptide transport system ATP-binding protein
MIDGDVPSPINPPSGLRIHTRCRYAMERCKVDPAGAGGSRRTARGGELAE